MPVASQQCDEAIGTDATSVYVVPDPIPTLVRSEKYADLPIVSSIPVAEYLKLEAEVRELKRVIAIEAGRRERLFGDVREMFRLMPFGFRSGAIFDVLNRIEDTVIALEVEEGV